MAVDKKGQISGFSIITDEYSIGLPVSRSYF
jgi:hypothetical protein